MDAVLNSEATLDCGNRPICVLDKTLNLSVHFHRRNENNDSYLRTFLLVQWLRLGVSSAGCLGLIPAQAMRWASLVAQRLKRLPAMRETWVRSLGREDPLEKEMATHSSTLAWRIPWMEEPGRLQSVGSQRVGHD